MIMLLVIVIDMPLLFVFVTFNKKNEDTLNLGILIISILCEPHAEEVSSIVGARMSYY